MSQSATPQRHKLNLPNIKRSDLADSQLNDSQVDQDQQSTAQTITDLECTFRPAVNTTWIKMYKPRKMMGKTRQRSPDMLKTVHGNQVSGASLMSMGIGGQRIDGVGHTDLQSTLNGFNNQPIKKISEGHKNAQIKKQVDQQQLIIENRIRRLNQEKEKTLMIIQKTIEQTLRSKSVQRDKQQLTNLVNDTRLQLKEREDNQRREFKQQTLELRDNLNRIKQNQLKQNQILKSQMKRNINMSIAEANEYQENILAEIRKENQARKMKLKQDQNARSEALRKQNLDNYMAKQEALVNEIMNGQSRIEKLAEVEQQLVGDLSSTQKMKQDVEYALKQVKAFHDGDYFEVDSAKILKQFELEYKAMKAQMQK